MVVAVHGGFVVVTQLWIHLEEHSPAIVYTVLRTDSRCPITVRGYDFCLSTTCIECSVFHKVYRSYILI